MSDRPGDQPGGQPDDQPGDQPGEGAGDEGGHLVSPELLAIMQCIRCAGRLEPWTVPPSLLCTGCGLRYPVNDGVPVMLLDQAEETR